MLNLFKLYYNKNIEKQKIDPQEKHNKHYPSAVREWNNSIYVFNKNAINLIPQATELVNKLIKSYFNLYNLKLERKIRSNRLLGRLRKLSSNKIYVSNGEFKHTNNKVVITLYLFNRQNFNIDKKIQKGFYKAWLNQDVLNSRWLLIQAKAIQSIKKWNNKKLVLIDIMESYTKNKQILDYKGLSKYIIFFYKKLIKKSLDKYLLHKYYQQLVFINKSKLNYNYLQFLKKYIEKIYNKNVEFNLVNLRRFYLNSDILSESITIKIRKNRRKLLKYLNTLKRKVKIRNKKIFFINLF